MSLTLSYCHHTGLSDAFMFRQCGISVTDRHEIEGHELIEGKVKATGNGAHVLVPKAWRGTDVKIVRTTESHE
jgi:hypothetical protein